MRIDEILAMEPHGADRFLAYTPAGSGRSDIFGGQVAGQALSAACHTVADPFLPNSVHCYFMRRGRPDLTLDIRVTRIRDGRTYANRRVEVWQADKEIFEMSASFHAPEAGPVHATGPPGGVPAPEGLPGPDPLRDWEGRRTMPFDIRNVDAPDPLVRWWGRFASPMADTAWLHYAALLYASDMRAGGAAIRAVGYDDRPPPGGRPEGPPATNFGSLDHSVWFHRRPAVDDWFLCDYRPLVVSDSRGMVVGGMFDRDGNRLASVCQEMFLKVLDEGEAPRRDLT